MLVDLGLLLKDRKNEVLLTHAASIFDAENFCHFNEVADFLFLEFAKVHALILLS
jgi:hypothetical protein